MAAQPRKDVDVGKAAKTAAGGVTAFARAAEMATGATDKLISKKAALKDVLGGGLGNIANAAKAAGGPLGDLAGKIEGFSAIAGRVPPQIAAIIIAVTVLAAVCTAGAAALYKMAEAAISLTQQRVALLNTFSALSWGGTGGKQTLAAVDALAAKLPIARDKIAEWATEFQKANLQGRDLEEAVKAVAAATALMGEKGGAAAQELIQKLAMGGAEATAMVAKLKMGLPESRAMLADMGLRVEDLADALGVSVMQFKTMKLSARQAAEAVEKALAKKGAGPLADMALTFPAIMAKLKEGLLSLFDKLGPSVKVFMTAVKKLFGEFSKGGAGLKALKPIVTSVMMFVFKWLTKAVDATRQFVLGLLGVKSAKGPFAALGGVVRFLGDVIKALKGPLSFIIDVFSTVVSMFVEGWNIITEAIDSFYSSINDVVDFLVSLVDSVGGVGDALSGMASAAVEAGSNFISGLVDGIGANAGAVIDAITALAGSAIGAFKSALGIASPSKVMMKMGGFAGAGAAEGLDNSASAVEDSAASLGGGVKSGAAKGMAGAGGKGGGGKSITIEAGAIVIHAGGATITEEALAMVLERLLASQGA